MSRLHSENLYLHSENLYLHSENLYLHSKNLYIVSQSSSTLELGTAHLVQAATATLEDMLGSGRLSQRVSTQVSTPPRLGPAHSQQQKILARHQHQHQVYDRFKSVTDI